MADQKQRPTTVVFGGGVRGAILPASSPGGWAQRRPCARRRAAVATLTLLATLAGTTLAVTVSDVSAFVAGTGLDRAAMSLFGLADNCAEAEAWRWDAVDVHLNALKLLRSVGASLPAAQRDSMLQGLYKVSHFRPDES